ncbi:MAG: DUF5668 domain-containing protein [Caldimonas sp.]
MSWSGIVLIIVGGALLANTFGFLEWGWLRQWWPLLLIVIGLWSVLRPQRGDHRSSRGADPGP